MKLQTLGETLKQLRIIKRVSYTALEKEAQCSYRTIVDIETDSCVSLNHAISILNSLGIEVELRDKQTRKRYRLPYKEIDKKKKRVVQPSDAPTAQE